MSKKITLKGINVIAYNTLETKNEKCVCTRELMGPSMRDIEVRSVSGCVSVGECGDGFHLFCINNWTKDNGNICPICKTTWKPKKTIDARITTENYKKNTPQNFSKDSS